ncbi:MAG: SPFH domain-containing protein [Thermoplasmatota archaeon]
MANVAEALIWAMVIVVVLVAVIILLSCVRIINPWEKGLKIVLGSYRGKLNPGLNLVIPLVTTVIRMDLRTQVFDVPRQEVITKDNSPTNVDAIIYIKVIDPEKAFFEITNYRQATIALAQTTLRSTIGDMELDEVLYNRHAINIKLRDVLDEATDAWGVKVEAVEIREVDPVGPVKAAMEEQTAAERERRAAILRADGEKRSAILKAEGAKRARILQAEGVRQSKILEAEGARQARILETQGEAQSLRLLTVGAALMDQKALTVKSLDTLAAMASGQATKIIFPFEITRLIEGASQYIGAGAKIPDRQPVNVIELERLIGRAQDVLGPIPSAQELRQEIEAIDKEIRTESLQAQEIAQLGARGAAKSEGVPPVGGVEEALRAEPPSLAKKAETK